MPGLGDALSKAFEDSMHDLDALVDKAAQEEEEIADAVNQAAEAEEDDVESEGVAPLTAAAEPQGVVAEGGVGEVEKTTLFAAEDLPLGEVSSPPPPPPSPPPPVEPARPIRRTRGTRRIMISEDMAGEAARSAIDATRILEETALRGASAQPGDVVGAVPAAGEEAPKTVEMPEAEAAAVSLVESPPVAPASDLPAKTQVTTAEPVAPFAQFAPSGIIRRKLRKGTAEGSPVRVAQPTVPVAPAASPPPAVADAVPVAEESLSLASMGMDVDGDVLAACRRVAELENADGYRIPLLADGINGLVETMNSYDAESPSMIAVCGAGQHFGTTTVAVACALKLAEARDKRTLLVDVDFRSPGLARLVGESGSGPDLKAVLEGEATLSEAVLYSPQDNLAVLPIYGWGESSGQALAGFGALLESEAFVALLELCREQFNFVILDAGSVAEWDGPALAAGAAGCAVLAVRAGRVTIKQARDVKNRLERCGSSLAGSVLTFA
jgi:protein-tyrosine kinase